MKREDVAVAIDVELKSLSPPVIVHPVHTVHSSIHQIKRLRVGINGGNKFVQTNVAHMWYIGGSINTPTYILS